jgi:hypothetical protein
MNILFIHPRDIFERNDSGNMDHVTEAKNVVKMVFKSMATIGTWPSAERGRYNFKYCYIVPSYIRQMGAGSTALVEITNIISHSKIPRQHKVNRE